MLVLRRIDDEKSAFAQEHGVGPGEVYAKVGCAEELHKTKQNVLLSIQRSRAVSE